MKTIDGQPLVGRHLIVTFSDGRRFAVPELTIARSRAAHFADEFGGDVERSLVEGTLALFKQNPGEMIEWATCEMNWSDCEGSAVEMEGFGIDRENEWANGVCLDLVL